MKANRATRFTPSQRALHRYIVRQWSDLMRKGMEEITAATVAYYVGSCEAYKVAVEAATQAAKDFTAAICGEFIRKQVIQSVAHEVNA